MGCSQHIYMSHVSLRRRYARRRQLQRGAVHIWSKSNAFRACKQVKSVINSIVRDIEAWEANGRRCCNRASHFDVSARIQARWKLGDEI